METEKNVQSNLMKSIFFVVEKGLANVGDQLFSIRIIPLLENICDVIPKEETDEFYGDILLHD